MILRGLGGEKAGKRCREAVILRPDSSLVRVYLVVTLVLCCATLVVAQQHPSPGRIGDLTLLVVIIRGTPDSAVRLGSPVIESKIKLFRRELVKLSKTMRDTRFVAEAAKKVPVWFERPSRVRIGDDMEVDVTVAPLREGKHPLRVIWYQVKDNRWTKIASSATECLCGTEWCSCTADVEGERWLLTICGGCYREKREEAAMIRSQPRYLVVACRVLRREIYFCAARVRPIIDVEFLPQGLHDEPARLRWAVQRVIDEKSAGYDAVLLGYGLCSNGVEGVVCQRCPLVLPRAHDCITLLIGSRHRYQRYFDAHPGTYWYSPGWIEESRQPGGDRYRETFSEYVEKYGRENAEYLMRLQQAWLSKYRRAAFVNWNLDCSEEYRQLTRRCAEELGWEYDELEGDPRLLVRMLSGEWDEDEFVIVPPGYTIKSAFNEDIVVASPVDKEDHGTKDVQPEPAATIRRGDQ